MLGSQGNMTEQLMNITEHELTTVRTTESTGEGTSVYKGLLSVGKWHFDKKKACT